MSAPRAEDLAALWRPARYLLGVPRQVYHFPMQAMAGIGVFADADWAGGCTPPRGTSMGPCFEGAHILKHWPPTHNVLTLRSGEAELAGAVKGASEGLGLQSVAIDLGLGVGLRLHAYASAAQEICARGGVGKARCPTASQPSSGSGAAQGGSGYPR